MKWFSSKSITNNSKKPTTPRGSQIIKQISSIVWVLLLVWIWWWVMAQGMPWMRTQLADIMKSSIWAVWWAIGEKVETDEMWQITVLIAWVWGEWHRGTYNTDILMVASYSPANNAVTFLSLPRDLYVNIGTGRNWRINSYLSSQMRDDTLTWALSKLTTKVSTIVGVPIDHYVLVDFEGFEKMIDTLWWVQVDVPKRIVDTTYPADEYKTMVLTIESGLQMMDGDLALKYARSRHSTSDFDRSLRQQQIIQWIVKKLLSWGWVLKIKELYTNFQDTITTDLSLSQMLWLSKYLNRLDRYFSFVLQSGCNDYFKLVTPGCLLYAPDRSGFGWAAVLLPEWASASRISYYDNIQRLAYYTISQQPYLVEWARILLWNGIDKDQLIAWQNPNGVTNDVATELVKYGFNVIGIWNSNIKWMTSQAISIGSGEYTVTADLLRDFAPVIYNTTTPVTTLSGTIFSGNNELEVWGSWYSLSWVDLIMVIGNDYLNMTK